MAQVARESEAVACGVTNTEEERHYTWLEDYLERLEGKEARHGYYENYLACEHYTEVA